MTEMYKTDLILNKYTSFKEIVGGMSVVSMLLFKYVLASGDDTSCL